MNIRKQLTRIAAVSAVLAACFAGARSTHAGEIVVGNVPFAFTMGDKTFPAGEYQFQIDQLAPDTVLVRGSDTATFAMAPSRRTGGTAGRAGAPGVTFNVYGEQRFLSSIRTRNGGAVTLSQGSKERALAKVQDATTVAVVD